MTDGIDTTILGSNLNPFVSSSKNRNKPALDAGTGAPFFVLICNYVKFLSSE